MLREAAISTLHWCEKTLSVLKEQQLLALEGRIDRCPSAALFDDECRLDDIQRWWDISFYAQERNATLQLFDVAQMREIVRSQMEREIDLVSVTEHMLLERMLLFDGEAELIEWEEISAAQALVSRLWCSLTKQGDSFYIRLPRMLHTPMLEWMNNERHTMTRESIFGFDATIHGLLYIAGFLHADQPIDHFLEDVIHKKDAMSKLLARRYLCAAFDYVIDLRGEMILIHPGLADPEHLLAQLKDEGILSMELDQNMILGGMNGVFPEELPLFDLMCGALHGALRPEYTPEDAAIDLRLLAKQGVNRAEMEEVLAAMLTGLPTPCMLEILKRINLETPLWVGLRSKLRH